jgi:hypothetical protein
MKKLIFLTVCALVLAGSAEAASYKVSGKVYKEGTKTTLGGAALDFHCTWPTFCGASRAGTSSSLGTNHGYYSFFFADCGKIDLYPASCKSSSSCNGRYMWVTGNKIIGTTQWSGQKGWYAGNSPESKNLYLSDRGFPYLGIGPLPVIFPGAAGWPDTQLSPVIAVDFQETASIEVTGFNLLLTYDDTKMACNSVEEVGGGEFAVDISNISTLGIISVQGHSYNPDGVVIGGVEEPTELFILHWEAHEPETVDYTYIITDSNSLVTLYGQIDPCNVMHGETEFKVGESNCSPYFHIADFDDWTEAQSQGHIYPMDVNQWEGYISQWQDFNEQGELYPDDEFAPAGLYVYEGNETDPCMPDDAGLVMGWGDTSGDSSSAWVWDYKKDPDLSNCTINLVVTAPQWGINGQINKVSFGLQNPPQVGGPIRSWDWNCGAQGSGAPIIWGVPTRLTINTALTGVNAATPTASAYANNPGFNLKTVQWILVDENGTWVGGPNPSPGPGGFQFLWNYWHWIMISPNTTLTKEYYKKWSQAAVVIDANDPPLIQGWDEYSDYNNPPIVADDWKCIDDRPITDIHWWGSFIGWNAPEPPPVLPKSFHIGIWSDVPDPNADDPCDFSYPGQLIWEHFCDNYVMNFAGYDVDPRLGDPDPNVPVEPTEACFQFNQLLSQKDWFYQEHDPCDVNGTVYWLSISAVWDPCQPIPPHNWGWKTRPHNFNDDAVQIQTTFDGTWPPVVGSMWGSGIPIQHPPYPEADSVSFDMAFELTTNQPSPDDPPASPDLNFDGVIDLSDLAVLASKWLGTVQY